MKFRDSGKRQQSGSIKKLDSPPRKGGKGKKTVQDDEDAQAGAIANKLLEMSALFGGKKMDPQAAFVKPWGGKCSDVWKRQTMMKDTSQEPSASKSVTKSAMAKDKNRLKFSFSNYTPSAGHPLQSNHLADFCCGG